jgi:hypothetical protein
VSAEFVLHTAVVRAFVTDVRATIAGASSPEEACQAIRPRFAELLADPDWLPAEYQAAAPESGMRKSERCERHGAFRRICVEADAHLNLPALVMPTRLTATPRCVLERRGDAFRRRVTLLF